MINFGNNSASSGRFYVQSSSDDNDEFVSRQKSVFEQLDAVAKDKEKVIEKQNSHKREMTFNQNHSRKRLKYDTRPFRGQESIFKQPEAPPPPRFKTKNIPDHQRNPQNWTKYTLSDVSQDDMSDKSNTAAAMSFLRELRAKKDLESMEVDSETSEKITFRKPSFVATCSSGNSTEHCSQESKTFKSSKVVMPEYVVGEKKSAVKKTIQITDKTKKRNEINLGHLNEYDDE